MTRPLALHSKLLMGTTNWWDCYLSRTPERHHAAIVLAQESAAIQTMLVPCSTISGCVNLQGLLKRVRLPLQGADACLSLAPLVFLLRKRGVQEQQENVAGSQQRMKNRAVKLRRGTSNETATTARGGRRYIMRLENECIGQGSGVNGRPALRLSLQVVGGGEHCNASFRIY